MKKKLLIILWILLVWAILGYSIFSLNKENTIKDTFHSENAAQLILFYWKTCPHCKAEEWYLDTLKEIYDFEVVWYEVYYSKENREKMKEYWKQFWTEFDSVPLVIMWDDYFLGANYNKTVALLDKYATKKWDDECLPEDDEKNQNTNPIVECTGDNQNTSPFVDMNTWTENPEINTWITATETWDVVGTWSAIGSDEDKTVIFWKEISLKKALNKFWPVLFGIVLWLSDGINPCMFWVLIFLLTYLASVWSKKKMLISGLIFAATTFVLYYLIMYWIHVLWVKKGFLLDNREIVQNIIWILAIIFWLIEIKDFFRYGKWVSLAIPKWAKPTLEYVTKKWTYMSAFILAVLSTFVELGCTILIPLAYVQAVWDKVNIFASLWIYNFFFVLPLLIIIFGMYYWISAFKTKDGELAINQLGNKKIMRLVAWLILLTLWILFLTKVL